MTRVKTIRVCASHAYEDPSTLVLLADNPRRPLTKGEEDELDESVFKLGLFRPLLVWRGPDGTDEPKVIGGNQRFKRLKLLTSNGHKLVMMDGGGTAAGIPVTDYIGTEAQAKLVALRDNNSDGDWDWSGLASFTANLDGKLDALDDGLGMDLSGFDQDFLKDLSAYGAGDEARVMEAATRDDLPPEPADKAAKKKDKAKGVSDDDQKIVGVVIGHVRGRLKAPTYRRLISALALEVEEGSSEGLDTAMSRLLDRLNVPE